MTRADIQIMHNDSWSYRNGSVYFPNGQSFDYRAHLFAMMASQTERIMSEAHDHWCAFYTPHAGDVVVDVGAGGGEDTLAFSQLVGESGRVIAIEANPSTYARLERFCRLNGLANTTPLHAAVMNKRGVVGVVSTGRWEEDEVTWDTSSASLVAPAQPFDAIRKVVHIDRVSLLKVNIEGAELHALHGMVDSLQDVEHICVACHDFRADRGEGEHFRTRAQVEALLSQYGFSLRLRSADPRPYVRDHVFGSRFQQ